MFEKRSQNWETGKVGKISQTLQTNGFNDINIIFPQGGLQPIPVPCHYVMAQDELPGTIILHLKIYYTIYQTGMTSLRGQTLKRQSFLESPPNTTTFCPTLSGSDLRAFLDQTFLYLRLIHVLHIHIIRQSVLGCPAVLSNGHNLRGIGPISLIF